MNRPTCFAFLLLAADPSSAATLDVTTLEDVVQAGDGQVSLREALIAAEQRGATDLGQAGEGRDFVRIGVSGDIVLRTALPTIRSDLSVVGPGADRLTLDAPTHVGGAARIFQVDGGGSLRLSGMRLRGVPLEGFAGGTCEQRSGCGGGGASLGGLVFLNIGSMVLEDMVFEGGQVIGGAGGTRTLPSSVEGGGGGAGFGGPGGAPSANTGGIGGSPAPFSTGPGAGPAQDGVEGGGGGGGNVTPDPALSRGGAGGFGGGGGGGGSSLFFASAPGGAGGFGGGGGGRGGGDGDDGPGAPGGAFGGAGGPSSGNGNLSGGGGGGAGLGGCVFARSGSIEIANSSFVGCTATGGPGGNNSASNLGAPGQGKGGAIFIADAVGYAVLASLRFEGSMASDAGGSGYAPGVPNDTHDVHGTVSLGLFVDDFE